MIIYQMFALVVQLVEMSSFWIVADGQPCLVANSFKKCEATEF